MRVSQGDGVYDLEGGGKEEIILSFLLMLSRLAFLSVSKSVAIVMTH